MAANLLRVGYLDMAAIARKLGLSYGTIRTYHGRAARHRRDGTPKTGDFPPPDEHFGATPVWWESTIDHWMANRPGQGAGGGRRKEPS